MGQGLAESGEHFRQSDVTFWGIVALVLGALALLFSNLGAILPPSTLTGLHSTRLDGGNLNYLRTQVADLRDETARIRNENSRLMNMLTLAEQDQNAVTQRVGAIESSLPTLFETAQANAEIDRSFTTSAIATDPPQEVFEADGGTVAVTRRPFEQADVAPPVAPVPQTLELPAMPLPLPPRIVGSAPSVAFGIALGPQVTVQDAFVAWKDITTKAGPLLLGLGPLLSGNAGVEQQRLVAGPIGDYEQAEQLCIRMIRIGISCLPVPYAGQALPE